MRLNEMSEYDGLTSEDNACQSLDITFHDRDFVITYEAFHAVILHKGTDVGPILSDIIFTALTKEINSPLIPSLEKLINYFPDDWLSWLETPIDFGSIMGTDEDHCVVDYIVSVVRKRVPQIEDVIIRDRRAADGLIYAINFGRWPELENIIIKIPHFAAIYAKKIIKGRWPEAEKYINDDEYAQKLYESFLRTLHD